MLIKNAIWKFVFLYRVRRFENGAGETMHPQIFTVMGICFFTSFRGRHIENGPGKAIYPITSTVDIIVFQKYPHKKLNLFS